MTMKIGWPEYAIEAALLAAFMVSASAFTILVDHPRGPLYAVIADPAMRRLVVGCAMGITAAALIYSRWGSRSGAHMNPAVTLALATSRGLGRRAIAGYVAAQFAGGIVGMAIAAGLFGSALAHPAVNWVITRPGPRGAIAAFAAELLMTVVMMTVVLWMSNRPRLAPRAGLAAAAMVTAFITVEAPLSGMSLNPARTFGSALFASDFTAIWIYFIAPTAGMLMAVAAYRRQCPTGSCPLGLHPTHYAPYAPYAQYAPWKEGPMNERYDVIIVGSGAGGGTLAYRLASTGKRILILERGDYVRREKANWDSRAVNVEGRYQTKEVWRDKDGKPLHPHTNYNVGGNTKFYGAALFRLRERDFEALPHHGGVSPAWPIDYAAMEPYYTEAEHLYQVHGERGVDPTEPWASAPYRFPKVSHEPRIQRLHDDLQRAGLSPFHVPLGVMLDESAPPASPCLRCNTCDGFPCLVHAKSDAHVICIEPALRHANVTMMTGCRVTRLETSASGREVTSVVVEREGEIARLRADLVVVSAGAINSAALLLRSASTTHPDGLANRSGQVGRNYMGHINSVLLAISATPNPTVFQKTLALNDFYFGDARFPHPMGHISFVGKFDAVTLSAGAPPVVPGMALDVVARHSLDFWLTSEDLPHPDNRVSLDREGNIVLSYTPNNVEGHTQLIARLKSLLETIGARHLVPRNLFVGERIPLAGVAHQNGTIRFGRDPRTSPLDENCRAHDVDNLYVVDGSFFPSSGAVNPALTIMANALRVGDHLRARMGVGAAEVALAR